MSGKHLMQLREHYQNVCDDDGGMSILTPRCVNTKCIRVSVGVFTGYFTTFSCNLSSFFIAKLLNVPGPIRHHPRNLGFKFQLNRLYHLDTRRDYVFCNNVTMHCKKNNTQFYRFLHSHNTQITVNITVKSGIYHVLQ